ncbi:MAG TPA: hypothetical protein ACHBX0_11020 [Arsenophonus sp.]
MRIVLLIIFIISSLGYTPLGFASFTDFARFSCFIGFDICDTISGPLTINGREIVVQGGYTC